jgi:hypothetical protein
MVGSLEFDEQGVLTYADKNWTPEGRHYSDGELGKSLVTVFAGLVREGKTACTIEASRFTSAVLKSVPPSGPRVVLRDAVVRCGDKGIRITATAFDGEDSMQVAEEIGTPRYVVQNGGPSDK